MLEKLSTTLSTSSKTFWTSKVQMSQFLIFLILKFFQHSRELGRVQGTDRPLRGGGGTPPFRKEKNH